MGPYMAPVVLVTGLPKLVVAVKLEEEDEERGEPPFKLDICATAARRVEETRSKIVGDQPPVDDALPEQLLVLTLVFKGAY